MAYKEKEHDYKRLERDLSEGELEGIKVIALYGHEDYLVKSYEKRILGMYVEPAMAELDHTVIEGESASADQIISHSDTLPMLSSKRVVSVIDHPALMSSRGMDNKGDGEATQDVSGGKEDAKKLAAYIETAPETSLILFIQSSVDTKKVLSKCIAKYGKIYNFERLDRKDLASFIKKRFRAEKKNASDEVIREIINSTGYFDRDSDYSLNDIAGDVTKIASFCQETEITPTDVSSVLSTSLETDAFALLDSLSRGNKSEAMLLVSNIMGMGESSFRLLALIISQFELMLGIKELSLRNMDKKNIMNELGIKSEFRYRKVSGFIGDYSVDKLSSILKKLYEVEKNIKTGVYDDKLAMTMFVAEI